MYSDQGAVYCEHRLDPWHKHSYGAAAPAGWAFRGPQLATMAASFMSIVDNTSGPYQGQAAEMIGWRARELVGGVGYSKSFVCAALRRLGGHARYSAFYRQWRRVIQVLLDM